jgi:hypothetical protein
MTSQEEKEIAERWVLDLYGPEGAPHLLFEDDSYFAFHARPRRSFVTGDAPDGYLGEGVTILDKRDGRIFSYGSGYLAKCLEENCVEGMGWGERVVEDHRVRAKRESVIRRSFPDYDRQKPYRVFIRKIHDQRRLLELLESFELYYAIPEIETNTIWRVPKRYNEELLRKRLSEPVPIVFGYFGTAGTVDYLYQLLVPCDISIEDYQNQKKTNVPSNAKPGDLDPEW